MRPHRKSVKLIAVLVASAPLFHGCKLMVKDVLIEDEVIPAPTAEQPKEEELQAMINGLP